MIHQIKASSVEKWRLQLSFKQCLWTSIERIAGYALLLTFGLLLRIIPEMAYPDGGEHWENRFLLKFLE